MIGWSTIAITITDRVNVMSKIKNNIKMKINMNVHMAWGEDLTWADKNKILNLEYRFFIFFGVNP